MSEQIECRVCGKRLKFMTHTHLDKHGMSMVQYRQAYPDARLSL